MPILFRECTVDMEEPITLQFLPTALWPQSKPDDPLLCGVLDAGVLRRSFREMPRLNSITVSMSCGELHELRGDVAAALLSAPQVRDVDIGWFLFCPRQSFPHNSLHDISPLTSLQYTKNPYHLPPRAHPSELEAIAIAVCKLNASLEVLKLPSETTPLQDMSRLDWPRLGHLILHGDTPTQSPIPIIAVLCRMPRLRILTLELTILPGMNRQCIWPPHWTIGDPLPQIEELTVTHPHPQDLLYTHLPPSVRRMSLCCSPCYALQLWRPYDYSRWKSPLPSASELLRILSGSSLPHLTHLGIDYSPDNQEDQLLQHLVDSYPHLTSLELHRMGDTPLAWPEDTPTMTFVTRALSRLRHLDAVRLNLNMNNSGRPQYSDRKIFEWTSSRSLEIANLIAPKLGSSVTLLSLLSPGSTGAKWFEYRVSAAEGKPRVVSGTAKLKVRRS
ncbi:hypothetical protein OH76DRAFT_154099 [Lentinus brumalis]|uniref:F-box domain-containing protein n=1 Tax=Lentinus brumalis TaxID=2498619 RepID=A0A371CNU9_9APHY|nr:hypothetical protein OH76DRAFT_154099 [Polyporus brumalis]